MKLYLSRLNTAYTVRIKYEFVLFNVISIRKYSEILHRSPLVRAVIEAHCS